MLYSEIKERENRFKIALKIGFPFVILMVSYILLIRIEALKNNDIILLAILSLVYIYFIFYLIYSSFKDTLIDFVSKTFNRTYILELLEKAIKSKKQCTIVMLKISNIYDINDRYGVAFGDVVVQKIINKLDKFLQDKKYNNVKIGRYGGGHFLIIIDEKQSTFRHECNIFVNELKNKGIDGVEVKLEFTMTSSSYDKNSSNVIEHLMYKFEYNSDEELVKPDIFDKLFKQAIDNESFVFFYQPILEVSSKKINIYEVFVKLEIDGFGSFTNVQLINYVNKNGYESFFDEKKINAFLPYMENFKDDDKVCLHISSVVLRSSRFKKFIKQKIINKEMDPTNIIFAFQDEKSYHDIKRFEEILKEYKKMGFSILLNHFGGNNAGLEYIKWLPIDYASFDLEFTKYLKKPKYYDILFCYIKLLKKLKIVSIVKFVETTYTYDSLKKMEADMLQGYIIGKTKKLEEKI